MSVNSESYFKYWGKASKEDNAYHLLPYHCLDVVAVADVWLQGSSTILAQTAKQIDSTVLNAKSIMLFFIALHDLGKFDARFQEFLPELREKLQGDDYEVDSEPYQHGSYGYLHFRRDFPDADCLDAMRAVAGHHGFCDTTMQYFQPDADAELVEQDQNARKQWIQFCLDWFKFDAIPDVGEMPLLAGLCSVADWVGSSMTNFTTEKDGDLAAYYQDALKRAKLALDETKMLSPIKDAGFSYLFPDYSPQGVQKLLPQLPLTAGLSIVEADTGSGKTEFALAYASLLIDQGLADGIVFGLPTQATTNGLFNRVGEAANKLFPDSAVTLAHSKSKYLIPDENGFLHKSSKRAFLGSMSVATIDQILMGVLPIKHQFVRSFGTRKSVLILDEVHSFDAYMGGLIEQVLKGQHQAFSSVILLSATLPEQLKAKLLKTYGGKIESDDYPLVTHVDLQGETTVFTVDEVPVEKTVEINLWASTEMLPNKSQCDQLLDWVSSGAMIAVICNTVADAQLLYQNITAKADFPVDLFHARYTVSDRLKREKKVLDKYGKQASRQGSLLISTQVVEQSLDLDFDLIVSQLAPIEFLMQRMGRLWRHNRNDKDSHLSARSTVFDKPKFIVLCPSVSLDTVDYSKLYQGSGYVYKNIRVLYRTQKYLSERTTLTFPACYRDAINHIYVDTVYGGEPAILSVLADTFSQEQEGSYYNSKYISNMHTKPLNDVNPRSALLTREGEMSQAVVLFNAQGEMHHGGDYAEQYDRELNTVSLSKKMAGGVKDEDNYCLKAEVNKDVFYSELGVYKPDLLDKLDA